MDANLQKFLSVLQMIGPSILAMTVPASVPFIPTIVAAIAEAQQIPGATGSEKKAHVLGVLEKSVTVYNGLAPSKIVNTAVLIATVSSGIDTVVGVVRIVEGSKVAADPALVKPAA